MKISAMNVNRTFNDSDCIISSVFFSAAGLAVAAEKKIRTQRYIYARLFSTIYTPELQFFIIAVR